MTFIEAVKKSKKHRVQFFNNNDVHFKVSEDGCSISRFDWATGQDGNRYWFLTEDSTVIPVNDILSDNWVVEPY